MNDDGAGIATETAAICEALPARLNIRGILTDAHARLRAVPGADKLPPQFIAEKLAEILREIANHAVEEYTRRTGEPFNWVDALDAEPAEESGSFGLSFALSKDGHLIFDDGTSQG